MSGQNIDQRINNKHPSGPAKDDRSTVRRRCSYLNGITHKIYDTHVKKIVWQNPSPRQEIDLLSPSRFLYIWNICDCTQLSTGIQQRSCNKIACLTSSAICRNLYTISLQYDFLLCRCLVHPPLCSPLRYHVFHLIIQ